MSPTVQKLLEQMAPVIERLVEGRVERALTDTLTLKGPFVPGTAYRTGAIVAAHDGALWLAVNATMSPPGPQERSWRRLSAA